MAALGLALSACGGGTGAGSAEAASVAQSSTPVQGSVPTTAGVTQDSGATSASGTSAGSGSPASSGGGTSASSGGSTATTPKVTSVTISWVPPTENTDGTTLTNLSGYDIHYGTASHKYTQTITVSNPGLARYVMANLSPGTYYFAVAAVNSSGTESPLSAEVTATVN